MNRRELIGAMFGVAVVPCLPEKPKLKWPPILGTIRFYPKTDFSKWEPYVTPPITIRHKWLTIPSVTNPSGNPRTSLKKNPSPE